jgi:nitroreductase
MDIEYLLTSTRSARKTLDLDAPIDDAEIRECLRIACQAANGSNQQPWKWIIVRDAGLRKEIARFYRDAYLAATGGRMLGDRLSAEEPFGRLMSSTEWLVEHMADVPLHVIPCYEQYLPERDDDQSSFLTATLYGSIFPAVWNFQLALHTRGYGTCLTTLHLRHEAEVRKLLGIPETVVQGCLLPVARLRDGQRFKPAPRKPIEEVVAVDGWDGPPL